VEQYFLSFSLQAVNILVSSKDRGLVEHLLEPAIYLCKIFFKISESNKNIVIQTAPDKTEIPFLIRL
jgi:hypothetical protein